MVHVKKENWIIREFFKIVKHNEESLFLFGRYGQHEVSYYFSPASKVQTFPNLTTARTLLLALVSFKVTSPSWKGWGWGGNFCEGEKQRWRRELRTFSREQKQYLPPPPSVSSPLFPSCSLLKFNTWNNSVLSLFLSWPPPCKLLPFFCASLSYSFASLFSCQFV